MAWYEDARKLELQPESDAQVAIVPTQYIVHSIAAPWTVERIYEYWRDSTNLESHFGLAYDGDLGQFIGTQTRADANYSANNHAISIETASNLEHTDPWTTEQLYKLIDVGVWLNRTHGIPAVEPDAWDKPGMGFHSMFPEWSGGGTECPGDARRAQWRDTVLPEIQRHLAKPAPSPVPSAKPTPIYAPFPGNGFFRIGKTDPLITEIGKRLVAEGCSRYTVGPSPTWGPADIKSYAAWQRKLGYSGSAADGIPGPSSWAKLNVPRP